MTITVTDQDLRHYVENTLPEPGYDVVAIVDELRPHVPFGNVSAADYVPADGWEEHRGRIDRTSDLIDRMLKSAGIDEEAYWSIVAAHDTTVRPG